MPLNYDYDLLVIGSGPAGQRAAIQGAKLDKRVAIVERTSVLGGICVNLGTIPSKTLREAVIDLSGLRQRSLYGDSFRVKAEISAQDLLMRTGLIMQREREVVRSQLLRNHVHLVEGPALRLKPATRRPPASPRRDAGVEVGRAASMASLGQS